MDATKPERIGQLRAAASCVSVQAESPEVTALINRAKTGDADAFGDLVHLYEGRLIALGIQMGLTRDDAMDACQDAFIKVFRFIGRFRTGEVFYRWLHRIIVNVIYDHLRSARRPGVISVEELDGAQINLLRDGSTPLSVRVEASVMARRVAGALDRLTRQERIVFVLRDLQEMSSAEIGKTLRLSQVTVRRHCSSARQKLRRCLFPEGIRGGRT